VRNEINSSKEESKRPPLMQIRTQAEENANDRYRPMQKSGQGQAASRNGTKLVVIG
jgi:hypothetical protein